jgi:hypothetical protein
MHIQQAMMAMIHTNININMEKLQNNMLLLLMHYIIQVKNILLNFHYKILIDNY